MMSEQSQFGKRASVDLPDELEEDYTPPPAGPTLRHAFADEYEGFDQENSGDYGAEEVPPPVEGLWDDAAQPMAEIRTYTPPVQEAAPPPAEALWGGESAPQPYNPPETMEPQEALPQEQPMEYVPPAESWQEPQYREPEIRPEAYHAAEEAVAQEWREPPIEGYPEPEWAPQEASAVTQATSWEENESASPVAEEAPSFGPKLSIQPLEEASFTPEPQLSVAAEEPFVAPVEEAAEAPAPAPLSLQEELLAVVEQHRQWVESGGREGRRATFRGDHFRGADFSELVLSEASFRGAILPATKFRGANLDRADFVESDLGSADFTHASLSGATFQRAQLSQADFSMTNATESDFSSVEAVGATFQRARLEWSIFRDAQLGETDFRQANLSKSNLRGASLFRAKLEDANLTQADCREVNFDHANMERAMLLQANFRAANLQGVAMQAADFSQAIDVPMDAQVDSAQKEREWLQQEAQRMEILKAELLSRERELNLEREKLRHSPAGSRMPAEPPVMAHRHGGMAGSGELSLMLKKHSKLFVKLGAMWLVLVLAVVGILLNVISEMDSGQLNFLELVILGILLLTPLALSLVGVVKSMNLSSRLLDFNLETDS